ncbi:MAG: hypothetical protein LBT59_22120 [Clostridiales bacterium]|nr:hypothetical protein [Clostridiales bacterium]
MSARLRKHYRVARRETEPAVEENGIFIPEQQKTVAFGAALFLMVLVLVQSVLLGYLILSDHDED